MFLKRSLLVAFCVWLGLFLACRQQRDLTPDLKLTHEISPQPPRVGEVTITLRLTDATGKPLSGALLKLEGNMSHAGMAPVFAEAQETDAGRYRSTLALSMAGDWYVLVTGTLPNGRRFERPFEMKGVAP